MGILTCEVSQEELITEQNGQTFGTRGIMMYTYRVLFMFEWLISV